MNVLFDVAVVGVIGVRMLRNIAVVGVVRMTVLGDVAVVAVVVIIVAVVGVRVLFHAAVVGVIGVRMLLHAAVVGVIGVRMLRVVIARIGVDMGHYELPVGCVSGVWSRESRVILADLSVMTQVTARRLALGAVAVQVKQMTQRGESGLPGCLGEVPVDQVLELVVQLHVLDAAAGHAHEVVMVGQQRFGQLEVGPITAYRDAVDHTGAFEHFKVAVGRTDGKIGSGRRYLRQRDRVSRARKRLDQAPTPPGVATIVSRQAHPHHGVEILKGRSQVRLASGIRHETVECD